MNFLFLCFFFLSFFFLFFFLSFFFFFFLFFFLFFSFFFFFFFFFFLGKFDLVNYRFTDGPIRACITGCTLTLNVKQIHTIRLQLVRLEEWVQKQRGVSRDSFVCEMIKFSQSSLSRKADSAIGIDRDTAVTVKYDKLKIHHL